MFRPSFRTRCWETNKRMHKCQFTFYCVCVLRMTAISVSPIHDHATCLIAIVLKHHCICNRHCKGAGYRGIGLYANPETHRNIRSGHVRMFGRLVKTFTSMIMCYTCMHGRSVCMNCIAKHVTMN